MVQSFKNKLIKIPYSLPLFLLLVLGGCQKTYQPLQQPSARPTPVSFTGSDDSVSIGTENWRTFFDDPYLVHIIDTTLAGNMDLRIALQRIEVARAAYSYSQGFLLPQVDLAASAGIDRYGRYTMSGVGNYDTNLSDNVSG